jgi:hypothetical protein
VFRYESLPKASPLKNAKFNELVDWLKKDEEDEEDSDDDE